MGLLSIHVLDLMYVVCTMAVQRGTVNHHALCSSGSGLV